MTVAVASKIIAEEIKHKVAQITAKEKELKTLEIALIERERRVSYREEMVTKREKKIYG